MVSNKVGTVLHVFEANMLVCPRVALGARIDAEVAHNKGRVMYEILKKYQEKQQQQQQLLHDSSGVAAAGNSASPRELPTRGSSSSCPFGFGTSAPAAPADVSPTAQQQHTAATTNAAEKVAGSFEAARQLLYSWDGVPADFQRMVAAEVAQQAQQLGVTVHGGTAAALPKPLAFLDHAWGQLSPLAQVQFT